MVVDPAPFFLLQKMSSFRIGGRETVIRCDQEHDTSGVMLFEARSLDSRPSCSRQTTAETVNFDVPIVAPGHIEEQCFWVESGVLFLLPKLGMPSIFVLLLRFKTS
jgi:hypothetical protein